MSFVGNTILLFAQDSVPELLPRFLRFGAYPNRAFVHLNIYHGKHGKQGQEGRAQGQAITGKGQEEKA